jgi:ribosomal protein L18E
MSISRIVSVAAPAKGVKHEKKTVVVVGTVTDDTRYVDSSTWIRSLFERIANLDCIAF